MPITPKIMCDLYNFIDVNSPADLALWCSFLVAFYCLFRKANVAPKNRLSFNPTKDLSRQKFKILENDIILVYNNFSKTNQFMNRDAVIPLVKNNTKALDPIFHLKLLLSLDISPQEPAFSYLEGGFLKCITYDFFTNRLKSLLTQAGYSPSLYSGHSFRRGGATLLFQLGCDPLLIQALGDWSTDQFLKYCGISLDQRYSAQLLMSTNMWLGCYWSVFYILLNYPNSLVVISFVFYFPTVPLIISVSIHNLRLNSLNHLLSLASFIFLNLYTPGLVKAWLLSIIWDFCTGVYILPLNFPIKFPLVLFPFGNISHFEYFMSSGVRGVLNHTLSTLWLSH